MNYLKGLLAFFLFLLMSFTQKSHATHVVGGDITYALIDSSTNLYEVRLTLLKDCLNGQAPFDASITLFVFEGPGSHKQAITVALSDSTVYPLPIDFPNGCSITPSLCVESGEYITQVALAPSSIGYDISWARCCLAQDIVNISNPLGNGLTFTTFIPPTSQGFNSSPTFNSLPNILICGNNSFSLDYSASDADGDSLVYSFSDINGGLDTLGQGVGNPMQGGNDPVVDPFVNKMGAPPYVPLTFLTSYDNLLNPYNADSLLLDEATGELSGSGIDPGIYLTSIEVKEYRQGMLLSSIRQTLRITVINCQENPLLSELILPVQDTLIAGNRTVYVSPGDTFCYEILVNTPEASDTISIVSGFDTLGISINPLIGVDSLRSTICVPIPSNIRIGECNLIEIKVFSSLNCQGAPSSIETISICAKGTVSSKLAKEDLSDFILMSPNPGSKKMRIHLDALEARKGEIRIMDIQGRNMYTRNLEYQDVKLDVDTQNWPSGIYFVHIHSEGKSGVKRWLKE